MQTRRVAVRGIIFKNGKLLLAKFRQRDGSEGTYWGTFGGGLDEGESLTEGLTREMIEETGITPQIGRLLFVQQYHDSPNGKKQEGLEFFFHIENPDDYKNIRFEETTHGLAELTRGEFINPTNENVLPAFLSEVDIADYIEYDRPVFIWNRLT